MARIMDGLRGIARHLSAMLGETETFISVAGEEDSSFLSDLKNSLSFVIGALSQNSETGAQLAGAVSHVSGLIQNISASLNDIEEIASEIELIALNAQIKAARMAGNGGAFGVLAEAIRTLSDSTRNQTMEMTRTFQDLGLAALELSDKGDNKCSEAEIDAISAEMKCLLASLGQSHERLLSLLDGTGQRNGRAYGRHRDGGKRDQRPRKDGRRRERRHQRLAAG